MTSAARPLCVYMELLLFRYVDHMPESRSDQMLVEKCAPYMWNPVVPSRVYQANPSESAVISA